METGKVSWVHLQNKAPLLLLPQGKENLEQNLEQIHTNKKGSAEEPKNRWRKQTQRRFFGSDKEGVWVAVSHWECWHLCP